MLFSPKTQNNKTAIDFHGITEDYLYFATEMSLWNHVLDKWTVAEQPQLLIWILINERLHYMAVLKDLWNKLLKTITDVFSSFLTRTSPMSHWGNVKSSYIWVRMKNPIAEFKQIMLNLDVLFKLAKWEQTSFILVKLLLFGLPTSDKTSPAAAKCLSLRGQKFPSPWSPAINHPLFPLDFFLLLFCSRTIAGN